MKTTRSQKTIGAANELIEIREMLKEYKKREEKLRDFLMVALENEAAIKAGNVIIMTTTVERKSLDKIKLTEELGDRISEFEKITEYKKLEIKNVA